MMKKETEDKFNQIYDELYDEEAPLDDIMMAFKMAFEFSACVCEELDQPNSGLFADAIRRISIEHLGDFTCQ